MIATVVVLGVLLAPVLAWNGDHARNARDRSQTVRLPDLPTESTLAVVNPTTFAADRPGHLGVEAIRRALHARDTAPVAVARGGGGGGRGGGGGAVTLGGRSIKPPQRTAPLATKTVSYTHLTLPTTERV